MKRIFTIILSGAIIFTTILFCTTFAFATTRTSGDYEYKALEDGTIEICAYIGTETELTVPEAIDGYTVSRIGRWAFDSCNKLEKISLPDSITEIGEDAFMRTAYYRNEANWENGILYLDNYLIRANSEQIAGTITVRTGTKVIANFAFAECGNMTEIKLPDSLLTIGTSAFYCCSSLKYLVIPDSVTQVGALGIVDYNSIDSDKKYSALKSIVLGDGITTIPANILHGCGNLTEITLGENVASIGSEAFYGTGIESITIPNTVKEIGWRAFFFCDFLNEVTFEGTYEQWNTITIEDGNEYLEENIAFSEVETTISNYITEDDFATEKEKQPISKVVIFVLVILIIITLSYIIIFLIKNKRNDR